MQYISCYILTIAVEAIKRELPEYLDEIPEVSGDDFTFKKTKDSVEMWFRYSDGDIFVTINDVSTTAFHNSV